MTDELLQTIENDDADKLLEAGLKDGWKPLPSPLKEGNKILGHGVYTITKDVNRDIDT